MVLVVKGFLTSVNGGDLLRYGIVTRADLDIALAYVATYLSRSCDICSSFSAYPFYCTTTEHLMIVKVSAISCRLRLNGIQARNNGARSVPPHHEVRGSLDVLSFRNTKRLLQPGAASPRADEHNNWPDTEDAVQLKWAFRSRLFV